jgi:hypothetical protein
MQGKCNLMSETPDAEIQFIVGKTRESVQLHYV